VQAAPPPNGREGDTINAPALTTMLEHIVANNRARRSRR
jgi:hypothetical protein